jgi:hypothetical protein
MKRAFWLMALSLAAIAVTGCNRGWPSMFCNSGCGYEVIEECDPCCTSYFGAEGTSGGFSSGPAVETLPGPATS